MEKKEENIIVLFNRTIEKNREKILKLFPSKVDPDKIILSFRNEFMKNENIKTCEWESIKDCFLKCCRLGLEPGILNQIYVIPLKIQNRKICTFILGYKGMLELIWRSPHVKHFRQPIVYYDCDHFEMVRGTEEVVRLISTYSAERKAVGIFTIIEMTDGTKTIEHMFIEEIIEIRNKIPSYSYWVMGGKKGKPPIWEEHFESMAKKTLLRKAFTYLRVSEEVSEVINYENNQECYKDVDEIVQVHPEIITEEMEVTEKKTKTDVLLNSIS